MKVGDLARVHGGLISTAPIGIVVRTRPNYTTAGYAYTSVLVYWNYNSTKQWYPHHKLEKVV